MTVGVRRCVLINTISMRSGADGTGDIFLKLYTGILIYTLLSCILLLLFLLLFLFSWNKEVLVSVCCLVLVDQLFTHQKILSPITWSLSSSFCVVEAIQQREILCCLCCCSCCCRRLLFGEFSSSHFFFGCSQFFFWVVGEHRECLSVVRNAPPQQKNLQASFFFPCFAPRFTASVAYKE